MIHFLLYENTFSIRIHINRNARRYLDHRRPRRLCHARSTSALTKGQMTGTLNNGRQLYLATQQMALDGAANSDPDAFLLAW